MSDMKQRVRDLIVLALDDDTPEKEARAAAFKAITLVEKYNLLDSPLDGILGGFKNSDNETVKAVSNIVQRFVDPGMMNDIRTVAGKVKRTRRRSR